VGALLKIIRLTSPTHAVVLFDGECHNERKDIDADYKANRPDYSKVPEEETPFSQLPDIYAALKYLGIRHTETSVCETDDWIAGYAFQYGENMQIVISSFDSDFFQLINKNVHVLRYRGEKSTVWTEKEVFERFGVTPSKYADFKALTGDTADNIKGADKVGQKTAAWLINEFSDLDSLLLNADKITKPSVRTSIKENGARLLKNRRLIKLDGCAELPFTLDQLRYTYQGERTAEVLSAIGVR
jgi:DNA polymerase-1